MLFDWSSWFSLVPFEPSRLAPPGQRSLNIIPETWKPVSHWKMFFEGCAWFSVVPFEPSWQAPPGQRSLNIIPESWKPVSHWKMVFDGCAWFSLVRFEPSWHALCFRVTAHNKLYIVYNRSWIIKINYGQKKVSPYPQSKFFM